MFEKTFYWILKEEMYVSLCKDIQQQTIITPFLAGGGSSRVGSGRGYAGVEGVVEDATPGKGCGRRRGVGFDTAGILDVQLEASTQMELFQVIKPRSIYNARTCWGPVLVYQENNSLDLRKWKKKTQA